MAIEKMHISYNEIHQAIADCVEGKDVYESFKPTLIIAIGSGEACVQEDPGAGVDAGTCSGTRHASEDTVAT